MQSNSLAHDFVQGGADEHHEDPPSIRPPTPACGTEPTVLLCVHVTPTDARVYLDDELLSIGSYRGPVPCELRWRSLRVVAPGHTPWDESIMPATDLTVAVALPRKVASQAPPPPRPVRVVLRPNEEASPESSPPSSTDPLAVTLVW